MLTPKFEPVGVHPLGGDAIFVLKFACFWSFWLKTASEPAFMGKYLQLSIYLCVWVTLEYNL